MKTISEAAKEYILGYRQGYPSKSEDEDTDIFEAGVKFAQQWIPVEDELPKENDGFSDRVLTKNRFGNFLIERYDFELNHFNEIRHNGQVTHWRPIEFNL
jgi:hypothetical protein